MALLAITFTTMVEGVKDYALNLILIEEATWNRGIADLSRTILKNKT
jgi:hypothetical protein